MSRHILFVCPHGAAKSLIAATWLNQAGLPVAAAAAAAEDPYEAVPAPVVELLGDGAASFTPRRIEPGELERAARVIAIGCDVIPSASGGPGWAGGRAAHPTGSLAHARDDIERWDDVPPFSEDPEGCVAAIRRHVDELVAELRG